MQRDAAEKLLREQEEAEQQRAAPVEQQLRALDLSPEKAKRLGAILGYGTCSATLLVINKLAVSQVPAPSFILVCQLVSSVAAVLALGALGVFPAAELEPIVWTKARRFLPISLLFFLCLYTNVRSLKNANVDTVIVFRACSPIAVVVADWYFRAQALPSTRAWLALLGIVVGVIVYVANDFAEERRVEPAAGGVDAPSRLGTYVWPSIYFCFIVSEMVYTKCARARAAPPRPLRARDASAASLSRPRRRYVIDGVAMSTWSRVYYNNTLSLMPACLMGLASGELAALLSFEWSATHVLSIAASCVVATGISFFAFQLRAMVSAAHFTVIGVLNKVLTVLLNIFVWEHHAGPLGVCGLLICIVAGTVFQNEAAKRGR